MATNTANLNLIKPSGTDKIRIAQINQNMDILDEKIGAVGSTSLQAQISTINSQFESNQPYTPDITSASTGFAVANKIFVYARTGKILLINGRFEITNVGSDTSKDFVISLPSGMECYDRVGACGFMAFNRNVANAEKLSLRQGVNQFYSQVGAGGSGALGMVSTGYIMINAVLMLK